MTNYKAEWNRIEDERYSAHTGLLRRFEREEGFPPRSARFDKEGNITVEFKRD